ncbi:gcn5-related n-acetyltransferase [Truncatella angustata]|uniref:Gcn5-related n-acetyltransferase n=1 Tax=Truncatella angustata TaxID=152316 RepID=A0A9P8RP17_9PEZI|nr:gcn5-related n-acetyltransferase [Truncatella angustata]KAH6647730.1 gcn5-related n-acetyltransferase [Truncatella angustata]KAH8204479.1 hypothetical protein TruAng_001395 [Truncatella angustata]
MSFQFPPESYEILTPRLVLRSTIAQDAEAMIDLMCKVENLPMGQTEAMAGQTVEAMVARLERWNSTAAQGKNAYLAIALRDTNEVIGYMGFNCFRTKEEFEGTVPERETPLPGVEGRYLTDLGVVMDYRQRRKGYSTEVVSACLELAFNAIGCEVVRLETGLANEPWRGLMYAFGFGDLEEKGVLSYGDHPIGWIYNVKRDAWKKTRETLKAQGKWPL